MPFKESSVMDERMRFILEQEGGLDTMTDLCEAYSIARETGYYWLRRYREGGVAALEDRRRAPRQHPNQTPEKIQEAVLALRRAHMSWGPRKLKRVLWEKEPRREWPASSTIGAMLAREGLTVPRKKRRRVPPYTEPFAGADAPNRVWCADFKGWFQTGDGERIDPLTITDACSRYLLRCQQVRKTNGEQVQAIFEAVFRECGLPEAIRTDNGSPFASPAPGGLSRLSMWWLKLGIRHERIEPGCPGQNGRHERMHRTLKAETANPAEANIGRQQARFLRFEREYNELRPHQALGYRKPAELYVGSVRRYPRRLPELEYPAGVHLRKISQQGSLKWKCQRTFLSQVLARETVGLLEVEDELFEVYYGPVMLGWFDSRHPTFVAEAQR